MHTSEPSATETEMAEAWRLFLDDLDAETVEYVREVSDAIIANVANETKFNPHHDPHSGRFSTGAGGGTALHPPHMTATDAAHEFHSLNNKMGMDAVPRGTLKSEVAHDLSNRLASHPDWKSYVQRNSRVQPPKDSVALASDLIRHWSETSADEHTKSLALQRAVHDEFGLHGAASGHLVETAALRGEYAANGAAYRAFVRAQYDNTQSMFRERGITGEVTLYRGLQFEGGSASDRTGRASAAGFTVDGRSHAMTVRTQPASSWSYDGHSATRYAAAHHTDDVEAIVAARVPVSRVLSTPRTGFGTAPHFEFVVLGGTDSVNGMARARPRPADNPQLLNHESVLQ